MTTRREVVLDELEKWRAEGLVTPEQYEALRARYAAPSPDGDERLGTASDRGSFAVNAMQLVGGILLGAALVALVLFLDLQDAAAGWTFLLFGAIGVGAGAALHYLAQGREGLEEAAFAAGFVPLAVAGFPANDVRLIGILAAALAVGGYVVRRGRGPVVVLAGAAYVGATFAVAGPEFFEDSLPFVWLGLLLAFGALLLVWREETWTSVGLGLYMLPLALAFFDLLDDVGIHESLWIELLMGAWFGAFLALGIVLGNRGLVAGAAAGLTIDSVIFAADLGGPGTAVVVLLALGGLLVWQAEFLRAYFRRRGAR